MKSLDDEARAELLCFLVVGQLFAFAREGTWLRTDHLIESSMMWLSSNGATCDWMERARLVEISRCIARQESAHSFPRGDADLHRLFNLKAGWFLDYRSPIVQRIHTICARHVEKRRD
ncbi:hypothetical protein [Burkholderia cenocepacia]|uniref:Fis family transcriptional regulator n=1 Tax=Burkholderia cenocepacia TaxID=95486 RepID=A0ABD4UJC8_9BURK|nr:hypothetical protein [Burkholderia cenocepacia]MCW3698113.1 hypothetical protein [Burkholderia cenocepacia]MCW3714207.1 hypothetical protein [Burkholderia cenocepacia]MCW3722273.1 hypothetical protein [Burkholderia cenocepacia]MCW3730589.1 hypothetical protein [Burkholderia cenocepacia]